MSDKTLAPPAQDSTPATEVPTAPEMGYQEPAETLTSKKNARKKAPAKKAAPVRAKAAEVMVELEPEPEPLVQLPPLPLEEALPLFREHFTSLKKEIQKAIAAAEEVMTKARDAAARDHERMLSELKREVGRLVVQTTAAVTGKILTPEDQRRLSEETAKQVAA